MEGGLDAVRVKLILDKGGGKDVDWEVIQVSRRGFLAVGLAKWRSRR